MTLWSYPWLGVFCSPGYPEGQELTARAAAGPATVGVEEDDLS
jgi:hypothetical protein